MKNKLAAVVVLALLSTLFTSCYVESRYAYGRGGYYSRPVYHNSCRPHGHGHAHPHQYSGYRGGGGGHYRN